jgi:hypothetical protein
LLGLSNSVGRDSDLVHGTAEFDGGPLISTRFERVFRVHSGDVGVRRDAHADFEFDSRFGFDVIDRVDRLNVAGAHVKDMLRDMQIECRHHAHEHGIDKPEMREWVWPY